MHGNTNADMLDYLLDMRAALGVCNADKAGINVWAQEGKAMGKSE